MTNGHLALSLPWSAEQIHEDTEGLHEKEIFTFGSLAYVSCMKSVVAYILLFSPLCTILDLALKYVNGYKIIS